MKAIIMAGGKGERMGKVEKALLKINGETMIERVANTLDNLDIFVAVTKNTPKTKLLAKQLGLGVILTPGKGYHEDTRYLSTQFKEFLSVCVDLPFLSRNLIKKVLTKYKEIKKPICVAASEQYYKKIGFTPSFVKNNLVPIGLNIVTKGEDYLYIVEGKEVININTKEELRNINGGD